MNGKVYKIIRNYINSKRRSVIKQALEDGLLLDIIKRDFRNLGIKIDFNQIQESDIEIMLEDGFENQDIIDFFDTLLYEPCYQKLTSSTEKSLVENVFEVFDWKEMRRLEKRLFNYRFGFLALSIFCGLKAIFALHSNIFKFLLYGVLTRDSVYCSLNSFYKIYVVKFARREYPDAFMGIVNNTIVRAFQTAFGLRNADDYFPKKLALDSS